MSSCHFRACRCLFVALVVLSSTAFAQYFGQNKVRYETYHFQVMKTQHFDIYYYDREQPAIADMGRMAERWYARLSKVFNYDLSSRQPVILYADAADFRSTTVIPGFIGEATGGVTEPLQRRVVLPLAGPLAETNHVLGHELVHAFQYDMSSRGANNLGGPGGALEALPLWFIEGMAEYLSLGPVDPNTAMWMRDAVLRNKLPKISDLDNPDYFPYRYGQALMAYIGGRYGDPAVGQVLRAAARSGRLDAAINAVLHTSVKQLSSDWQQALKDEYAPVLSATTPPKQEGKVLISEDKNGGQLNVSPSISPDGKYLMFLSERGLFSIELYLADAETGAVKRKITSTAVSPHFNSLEFTNATGAWSSDSRLFAYPHEEASKPYISIYDVARDQTIQDMKFSDLGEITGVSWSPDGDSIVFSAMTGGLTDLFVVDVKSQKVRRLTNDAFADLQPAWSPDGKQILFVTDRFTSNLPDLSFGDYRLGLIDVSTGHVHPLPSLNSSNEIDPQWSQGGRSIYFVSDRNGIPNIYRYSLPDRNVLQVTNIQTGTAGITSLSPAISVSEDPRRLVYSAFIKGGYEIISVDSPQMLAGSPLGEETIAGVHPAVLPPRNRTGGEVASLLESPTSGLVNQQGFKKTPYHPGLTLDYVAPPSFAVGTSSFGTLIGGGTAFHFSDILNQHDLTLQLQTFATSGNNVLRNLSFGAQYLNQKTRWDWGFFGGQVPYQTGSFSSTVGTINGQLAQQDQEIDFWQIDRQVGGIFQYPFSRAQRVEFTAGYENIDFAAQARTTTFDPITGQLIDRQTQDIPTPNALNMAIGSTALVYDTSIFGGVSPVMGQSYRLQGGFNAGSLTFGTLLADYRKYIHIARPLSIAGRFLHYGRYGSDAESDRLQPLFLGYASLVRGYEPNSFSANECGADLQQNGSCPTFDRLVGSRIAVANAEVRLELTGPLGVIPSRGFLPIELAPFVDAGRAWGVNDTLLGSSRSWISSYGSSLRINILGFAVGQVSLVHPNDRPLKNWIWQFSLLPGY